MTHSLRSLPVNMFVRSLTFQTDHPSYGGDLMLCCARVLSAQLIRPPPWKGAAAGDAI